MNGFRNGCRLYHLNVLYNVESDRARYFYSFIDIRYTCFTAKRGRVYIIKLDTIFSPGNLIMIHPNNNVRILEEQHHRYQLYADKAAKLNLGNIEQFRSPNRPLRSSIEIY